MASSKRKITLACENLSSKSGPYCTLMVRSNSEWIEIGRTEVIRNTSNPVWSAKFELDFGKEEVIKFVVKDQDMQLLGSLCVSLDILAATPGNVFMSGFEEGMSNRGRIIITSEIPAPVRNKFMNFDIALNFVVTFDFTTSHGASNELLSRHIKSKSNLTEAVNAFRHILEDYDADNMFPAFGFGGAVPPNQEVSYNFTLNQHPTKPECVGVEGIKEAYSNMLPQVSMFGPTYFFPVIENMAMIARQDQDRKRYHVLLIITDRIIQDFKQTKSAIDEAFDLPMSIIIVGVGDADFSEMMTLNSDGNLFQSKSRNDRRHIVQFVKLNQYAKETGTWQKATLATDVMSKVSFQFVKWMEKYGPNYSKAKAKRNPWLSSVVDCVPSCSCGKSFKPKLPKPFK